MLYITVQRLDNVLYNYYICYFYVPAQVIPGLLVLAIGYLGCQITLILVIWFVAVTLITAAYAGAMANVVDIAPNFAGHVLAFAQTIHMSASFLSPLAAAIILQDNVSEVYHRKLFFSFFSWICKSCD